MTALPIPHRKPERYRRQEETEGIPAHNLIPKKNETVFYKLSMNYIV